MKFSQNKKAQTVVEFVIIFGFILFFFIVFFAAIQKNQNKKNVEKEALLVQNVALDVQDEINLAAEASDGYSRYFTVPGNILGKDYNITIIDSFIYVRTDERATSYRVFNVTGQIQKGSNYIRKENGTVYLN